MKKLVCMVLSVIMLMSFMGVCYADYATDNLPSDLPPGAIRIMDGVYQVPLSNIIIPQNSFPAKNIGIVPGIGTIIQPTYFNNIQYDSSGRYIRMTSDDTIRINLVSNTQNVFGISVWGWPTVSAGYGIYIDAPSYNMVPNSPYQLQVTSGTGEPAPGPTGNGVTLHIWSSSSTN